MTYGPPQPPNEPTRHTASGAADQNVAYSAYVPPPGSLPPDPHRQYPSAGFGGTGTPTPPPIDPAKGRWLAIVAVILGVLGCVLPLAPVDLTGVRGYLPLVFGLPGLVVGIIGCTGRRRGKALAAVGSVLCVIAIVLAAIMLIPRQDNSGPGDHTQAILRDDLDVQVGEWHPDAATGEMSVTVTLHNKGHKAASFGVTFQQIRNGGGTCETGVGVGDLLPGASYQTEMHGCDPTTSPPNLSLQMTNVTEN
jgi:hypothetical protein